MSNINLSKLKHKELPTKEIEMTIGGEVQKITIKAINGRGITALGTLESNDLTKNTKLCLLALIYGLDLSQEDAELLMDADTLAADMLAAEIISFTQEHSSIINEAKKEIKKNLRKKAI